MKRDYCDTLVIGAGIIGIATAYYLKRIAPKSRVILVDMGPPMALTSAQSGENYRNWWPHPIMTAFTDRSIDLLEEIAVETDNIIQMTRCGYVLATRSNNTDNLMAELVAGYADSNDDGVRIHDNSHDNSYQPAVSESWHAAPSGVDVLNSQQIIQHCFPSYDNDVETLVHIRRAGSIRAQQLGQFMLGKYRDAGGVSITGKVTSIAHSAGFHLQLDGTKQTIQSDQLVNAAGPFISDIAQMIGCSLPVSNILQQKIMFEDTLTAIPRNMPFSIDLDDQTIDWSKEEIELLRSDPQLTWLTETIPGAIHCRPDGGDHGTWIKLGWAFNSKTETPQIEPHLSDTFPEIVLRGAARLNPGLKSYYGRLPRNMFHYGGYYTMTEENWPLIGEMEVAGSYVVGAMSGFGTMSACAAGDLCARWVTGEPKPEFASALSLQRYDNQELMQEIHALSSRGIL